MKRRILAFLTAMLLVLGMLPATGLAAADAPEDYTVTNLKELMRDTQSWGSLSMDVFEVSSDKINMQPGSPEQELSGTGSWGSFAAFQKKIDKDGVWAFNLGLPAYLNENKNFGFKLRLSNVFQDNYGTSNYFFRVNLHTARLEIIRDRNWTETVIVSAPNTYLTDPLGIHEIVIGAVDVQDGVRLIWKIDGETVFDAVDNSPNAVTSDGFLEISMNGLKPNPMQLYPADETKYPVTPLEPEEPTDPEEPGDEDIYPVSNLGDLFANDLKANWKALTGEMEISPEMLSFTPGVYDYDGTGQYSSSISFDQVVEKDTVWAFKARLTNSAMGSKSWLAFQLRARDILVDPHRTQDYYIRILNSEDAKGNRLQLVRCPGTGAENILAEIPNDDGLLMLNRLYDIEIGALEAEDGIRLLFKVDGKTIFDYVDTAAGRITAAGKLTINMTDMRAKKLELYPADGAVKSVKVTPERANVSLGESLQFTAQVDGRTSAARKVVWSVEGGNGATAISDKGLLTVDGAETAGALVVVATAVVDTSKFATARVIIPENYEGDLNAIYVSPDGSDLNAGTIDSPFKTIKAAKDEVRGMISAGELPEGGITVYLRGGEYVFTDSLEFTAADSGTADSPVTYRAFENEEVSFTGAVAIDGSAFEPVTDDGVRSRMYNKVADKVVQVDLNDLGIPSSRFGHVWRSNPNTSDDPDTATLYVDTVKQTLARFPNFDYTLTGKVTDTGSGTGGATFQYADDEADRWGQATEAWAGGFWYWDWYSDTSPITVNTTDKTIKMKYSTQYTPAKDKRYFVFNLLEEIDMPGEWYLDRASGILYYYPSVEDLAGSRIQLATLEKNMVNMNGASNISFIGITFEATAAAAFNIRNADGVMVAGCTFRNIGGKVADMEYVTNSGFTGCDIYETSKGGIYINNAGNKRDFTESGVYVTNCYFSRFNLVSKTYAPAISTKSWTDGVLVSNNVIHDGPHSGILVAGVDNVYSYNELYELCTESDDAGAIYGGRNWTDRQGVYHNNVLHDITGMEGHDAAYGIYYDDNMGDQIMTSNIFYNMGTAIFGHGSWELVVDSNIFVNSRVPVNFYPYVTAGSNREQHRTNYNTIGINNEAWVNRFDDWTAMGEALAAGNYTYLDSARDNVLTNNITYKSGNHVISSSAAPTVTNENNVTLTDGSCFEDPDNNIYTLVKEVEGLGEGFNAPNLAAVGLSVDEYRSEIFGVNDFRLIYPANSEADIQAYKLNLMWNRAIGATYYNVTVASDPEFSDVVFSGTTKRTYIPIAGVEYGGLTYYWKVEAVSTSISNPGQIKLNLGGVYSFVTAQEQIGDTSQLERQIVSSKQFLASATVGNAVGEYPQSACDALEALIAEAEDMVAKAVASQAEVDAMIAALKTGLKALEGARVTGLVSFGTLMADSQSWVASSGGTLSLTPDKLTFKGSKVGYQKDVPNYAVWSLKLQIGQPGDVWSGSDWFAVSLRAGSVTNDPWGASCYLFVIKENTFEFQKFGGDGYLKEVANDGIFKIGTTHDVQIGVTDTAEGARIIVKIDGVTLYDYEEKFSEVFIPEMGFLGFYLYGTLPNKGITVLPGSTEEPAPEPAEVSVTTPTIVASLAANLNITAVGGDFEGQKLYAYLDVDGELRHETAISADGKGRMYIDAAPEARIYDLVVKTSDGTYAGSCTIEVVEYRPADLWEPRFMRDGVTGRALIEFGDEIGHKTGGRIAVTIGAAPVGYEITGDKKGLLLDIEYGDVNPGAVITASGVKYPVLFPSYSFTFTVTTP